MPSTSGRKLAKIVTGRTESELSQDIKDVLSKGTIEDILLVLQKVGAFQKELEKEGKYAESTQNRLWSWQMSLHFQILKLTQDSLAVIHKEGEGDGEVEIMEIMKNSFEILVYFAKKLASNEGNAKKVLDIYARLCKCFFLNDKYTIFGLNHLIIIYFRLLLISNELQNFKKKAT
jgi:hypothetical protein